MAKASLLSWVQRLETLNAPVKKHTQDFMVQYLLYKDGNGFHKFEVNTKKEDEDELQDAEDRTALIDDRFEDLIQSIDQYDFNRVMEELVQSKFADKSEC